jgi:Holliday junction resolvase RusA-like endonuclease
VTSAPDMLDVRFFVPGTCLPKGNHQAFPIARGRCSCGGKGCRIRNCFGGVLVGTTVTDTGGKELEAWQEMVRVQAISARNAAAQRPAPAGAAIELSMVMLQSRPEGHWTSTGALTSAGRARPYPSVKPDLDKLSRAVCDGLVPAIAADDSQFVVAHVALVYTPWRGKTGCTVRARRISSQPSWVAYELDYAGIDTRASQEALL